MDLFIFLGPAGSGKGTQAQYLISSFNFSHISTGDLLRAEVKSGSEMGKNVQSIITKGDLVPDEIIIAIIKGHLSEVSKDTSIPGIVFDGFPRTIDQAIALDSLIKSMSLNLKALVQFDLSLEDSITRISGRQVDSRNNKVYHKVFNPAPKDAHPYLVQRDDDSEEKVRYRFEVFQKETAPLISHYRSIIYQIDCSKSIVDIHEQMDQLVQSEIALGG